MGLNAAAAPIVPADGKISRLYRRNSAATNAANRLLNPEIPRKWGNEVVAYDDCSAAVGEWIALSEGAEAAAAFHPTQKPVDAFCGAILDALVVDAEVVAALAAKK